MNTLLIKVQIAWKALNKDSTVKECDATKA